MRNKHFYKAIIYLPKVLIIFILLGWYQSVSGEIYHVSKSGNDKNPGTENKPWLTIQKAGNNLLPGDTVKIHEGIYRERLEPVNNGEQFSEITFAPFENDKVIIDAEKKRDECINIGSKKYIRFKGITLTGAISGAFTIRDGSKYIFLDQMNCVNSRFGLFVDGQEKPISNIKIENSTFSHNSKYGIFLFKKIYDSVIGPKNRIEYNGGEEMSFGIEIGTEFPGKIDEGAKVITVIGNTINNNDVQGVRAWNVSRLLVYENYCHDNGASGIQIENGCRNVIVKKNRCEFNSKKFEYEAGIWIDDSSYSLVKENTIVGNNIGIMVTNSIHSIIRNNVIAKNNRGAKHKLNAMGICLNKNTYDSVIVHNTIYKNGSPSSLRGALTLGFIPTIERINIKNNIFCDNLNPFDISLVTKGASLNNNLIFNSRGIFIELYGDRISWERYKNISGEDGLSIAESNQKFFPIEIENFSLSVNSLAIDNGGFLTKTTGSGSGKVINVLNSNFFCDGFGMIKGDLVKVGDNKKVRIQNVNYIDKKITVNQDISWKHEDNVSYYYEGMAPDIGAFEYGTTNEKKIE